MAMVQTAAVPHRRAACTLLTPLHPSTHLPSLADCVYPDPSGSVPSPTGLLAAMCALATPGRTRAVLSFEARSDALRRALLDAAAAAPLACSVQRLPPEAIPEAYRAPHIELYELSF